MIMFILFEEENHIITKTNLIIFNSIKYNPIIITNFNFKANFIIFNFITFNFIIFNFITFNFIIFNFIIFNFITFNFIIFNFITVIQNSKFIVLEDLIIIVIMVINFILFIFIPFIIKDLTQIDFIYYFMQNIINFQESSIYFFLVYYLDLS